MNIEKITENKIRVIVTIKDLNNSNTSISNLIEKPFDTR